MAGLADGPPQVDACAIADLVRLEPQWRDLGGRAGEPNPFADSAFGGVNPPACAPPPAT